MVADLIGLFFGSYVAQTTNFDSLIFVYNILDAAFVFIIALSFYLYYKIYKYIEIEKVSQKCKDVFLYVIVTLVMLNVIFVGIIIEFVYLRNQLRLLLPIPIRIFWLVLSVICICMITKAYSVISNKCVFDFNRKK